ncbi:RagB/SusD family nutrient uptake outer membrane protein [Chitinophaga rhizophila]|uniref:RagB/SusD family nutrient uptake outer membrane protein n=1 Tax=Chitinophaga rhizophila TaxID=2866212 RepID=A0ABS7GB92_9BACT|nr:RagB/SusD family nutrient uptake outer membrane protein [Chitinophaga rhizophila]MBW8684410.1 RagB/SusD family nutrient uptake outer membrane protein [Chitinophaga rhizophila]
MNFIRKHKKLLCCLIVLLFTGITSCNNYLDVKPQGQLDQEASALDPATAQKLVIGVYNTMWEGNMHGFSFVQMTNIASDDADKGSNAGDDMPNSGALDNLTADASVNTLNSIWSTFYLGVARANQALSSLEGSTLDETLKNQLMGEVRFLRAYFYFDLVRFFGGVPKIDRVLTPQEASSAEFQTKASKDEIYAFIIEDLEYALANVAAKGQPNAAAGRASKAAAAGMLAKVMLYRQNWQRAYNLTDSIITQQLGSYGLLDNYFDIWRESGANSRESLFEVQTGQNAACEAAIANYAESQAPRAGGRFGWADLGWGFGTPSQSLVDEFEDGDLRRAATIITIQPTGTFLWDGFRIPGRDSVENDRYNYKSYHSQIAEANCGNRGRLPKNLRILRYGEVLLIHAEAALALGNGGTAAGDITQLHPRAGLGPVTTVTREDIWHERRVELAMEHDRFFDLIRQDELSPGRAAAAFTAHGKTFNERNKVFPIPQRQIDLSGGSLEQNEGYN